MYDIPEFFSPQQLVFRPYLLPSTTFQCSLSNNIFLPAARKKPLVSSNLVLVQTKKNTIFQLCKPSKILREHRPYSP